MDPRKHRKCTFDCDYVSTRRSQYYGDMICFCNYDRERYVGFIEDVIHGSEECLFPYHTLNDDERHADLRDAWNDFILAIKETEEYAKFQTLIDRIGEVVFK